MFLFSIGVFFRDKKQYINSRKNALKLYCFVFKPSHMHLGSTRNKL